MSDLNHHLFTGIVPPITLAHPIPTIEEAQARLAQVESECPGSYFWAFGDKEREAQRLAWIARKSAAKMDLDEAIQASKTGWFRGGQRVDVILNPIKRNRAVVGKVAQECKPAHDRKTPEQLVAMGRELLRLAEAHDPASKEWRRLRDRAQACGYRATERALQMGVEPPEFTVPPLPTGRKESSAEQKLETLTERWRRYLADNDRKNASSAAAHIRRLCRVHGLAMPAA